MKHKLSRSVGLMVAALAGALVATVGCATFQAVATPERIEAVAALGSYYGAQAAVADGKRAEVTKALAALKVVAESETADVATIAAAISEAGVSIGSPEGALAVQGAVLLFSDLWAGTGQTVLDDARARAALRGTIRGIDLALAPVQRSIKLPSGQTDAQATLIEAARRTRGKPRT